jgi:spermidine synthase
MSSEPALPEATLSEHDGVRYLHLGSPWVQGAMRLKSPQHIELEYVQRMLAALLWMDPTTLAHGHAVQLGLGAGALTRFTLRTLGMRTTAVELNPQVIAACRHWFRLPVDGPRLHVVCADAAGWLAEADAAQVQLLQVDLYDEQAAAPALDDEAFYAACRRLLAPGGVMAVNLFGRRASFARSVARIAAAFGTGAVWPLRPTREGNTVVIASCEAPLPLRHLLAARAAVIEANWGRLGLPARKWLRMLPAAAAGPATVAPSAGVASVPAAPAGSATGAWDTAAATGVADAEPSTRPAAVVRQALQGRRCS